MGFGFPSLSFKPTPKVWFLCQGVRNRRCQEISGDAGHPEGAETERADSVRTLPGLNLREASKPSTWSMVVAGKHFTCLLIAV